MAGLLLSMAVAGQQVAKGLTAANGTFIGFYQYTPTDYDPNGEKYPLIIFLHGMDERGNGTTELSKLTRNAVPKYINAGHKMRFFWNGKWQTFLVLSPQLSMAYRWWQNFYTDEMIKYAKANLNIDTNRISLIGLSLGGGGVWDFAAESVENGKQLNAVAPCCPTCQTNNYCPLAEAKLPLWAFHALDDKTTGANCTSTIVNYINNNCGAAEKGYQTIWPTGGHGVWDRAFDTAYRWQNPNVYEWLLGKDKSKPVNVRPVANAGPNITISTTTGYAHVSGARSTDADGTIQRYIWKQTAGPVNSAVVTPVSTHGLSRINGLTTAGTYTFELTVVDDRTDFVTKTMTITVVSGTSTNIPPVTEAGANITTGLPSVALHGSDSYDPDGTTLTYKWTRVGGPAVYTLSSDAVANPDLTNLLVGTYQFQLETTDAMGAKTQDLVTVNSMATMLPTTLSYFKGRRGQGANYLEWATAQEADNDHFVVERSADGQQFTSIGQVKAAGNSLLPQSYSFTDAQASTGAWYYRLKLLNTSGKTLQHSSLVRIDSKQYPARLHYFPNPAKDQLTIQVSDDQKGLLRIRLMAMDGRVVQQKQWMKQETYSSTDIHVKQLLPGIYLLEVTIGDQLREIRKVIKE